MGLCTVVGQLLKQFAPDMDVQPLLALGSDVTLSSPAPSSSDEERSEVLEETEEDQELQQEQQQMQLELEQQKLGVEADAMTLRV